MGIKPRTRTMPQDTTLKHTLSQRLCFMALAAEDESPLCKEISARYLKALDWHCRRNTRRAVKRDGQRGSEQSACGLQFHPEVPVGPWL